MKPSDLERLPLRMEQLYREVGELMMEDVVRRIQKTGKITSTADYQIQRLVLLGATSEEIESEIQKRLNLSYSQLWKLYDDVVDTEYVRNKDIYEQINSDFIPWENNYQLQQVTKAIMVNALMDLKNITRSMGFAVQTENGLKFTQMADFYQRYLDKSLLSIVTGAIDYNTALRKCVTMMTNSGIRTVDYASGHSNRIDVAARRAVMTGLSQVTGKINDYHANRLGIDTFEVAWHAGARNTGSGYFNHQSWQGRVYTTQQLHDVCGLGEGGGLLGWNCYHEYYLFFPGYSERNWSDEWLENMNAAENTPREYNGKWYDMYQATQKQRSMETAMRAQRQKVRLLQKGEADKDTIMNERIKYNNQLYEYTKFSNKMNLTVQRNRIYQDNLGTVGIKGKTPFFKKTQRNDLQRKSGNDTKNGRINRERISKEKREYANLTLEEFKKMHHTVSKEERKILYGKTHFSGYINSSNARKLNAILRNDGSLDNGYQRITDTLSAVIEKNTIPKDIVVTRFVAVDALEAITGCAYPKTPGLLAKKSDIEAYWGNIASIPERIQKRHKYTEKGFLSTSGVFDKNVMQQKGVQLNIKVPRGTKGYITTNDKESEIIFNRGTTIEILDVRIENNKSYNVKIVLECIMR